MTLTTAGASVDEYEMGLFRRIQQTLADPNLAFLFLSIGTLGLIYELATPGIGAGGVVGLTCILLALFSLAVLPVSAVGILLLLLSAAMFVAELFAPGVGIAAAGGTATLLLSGIFLFRDTPGLGVSMAVVVPVAVVVGGAVVVAGRLVWRARRAPSTVIGPGLFVGRSVAVKRTEPAPAQAFVEGAWWNIRTTATGPELDDGALARIVDVDGLDLIVEPCAETDTADIHELVVERHRRATTIESRPELRDQERTHHERSLAVRDPRRAGTADPHCHRRDQDRPGVRARPPPGMSPAIFTIRASTTGAIWCGTTTAANSDRSTPQPLHRVAPQPHTHRLARQPIAAGHSDHRGTVAEDLQHRPIPLLHQAQAGSGIWSWIGVEEAAFGRGVLCCPFGAVREPGLSMP